MMQLPSRPIKPGRCIDQVEHRAEKGPARKRRPDLALVGSGTPAPSPSDDFVVGVVHVTEAESFFTGLFAVVQRPPVRRSAHSVHCAEPSNQRAIFHLGNGLHLTGHRRSSRGAPAGAGKPRGSEASVNCGAGHRTVNDNASGYDPAQLGTIEADANCEYSRIAKAGRNAGVETA
jgi:hypothetical protein